MDGFPWTYAGRTNRVVRSLLHADRRLMKLIVPPAFKDTFGLRLCEFYPKVRLLAEEFTRGEQYTAEQVMNELLKNHPDWRKSKAEKGAWCSKRLDYLVYYDLLEYKDGYYYRTKLR